MTVIPYLHATCVEKDGLGVLLRGHAGAGKSSFALALINRGFKLVADDQVRTSLIDGFLTAQPAEVLKGLLEVRGLGILKLSYSPVCQIQYLIDLVPGFKCDRLPSYFETTINGARIQSFQMNPMDPNSVEKVLVLFNQDFLGFDVPHQKGETASTSC